MSSISFSGLLQVVTDGMMKMMAILLIYNVSYKSLHYMHSLEKGEVHYIIFFFKKTIQWDQQYTSAYHLKIFQDLIR